jgi:hypothetical protein
MMSLERRNGQAEDGSMDHQRAWAERLSLVEIEAFLLPWACVIVPTRNNSIWSAGSCGEVGSVLPAEDLEERDFQVTQFLAVDANETPEGSRSQKPSRV